MKRKSFLSFLIFVFLIHNQFSLFAQGEARFGALPGTDNQKITLDIKGMDIVEVLKMLSAKAGMNVVIGKNVKGRATLFLKSVDIKDAFEIILVANDLACDTREEITYVMTQKDYEMLYGKRYGDQRKVSIVRLKFGKANEITKALNQVKTKIGKVIVDEGSNSLILMDSPAAVRQMKEMVQKIDIPVDIEVFDLRYAKVEEIKPKIQEMLTKGIGMLQTDERTNKLVVIDSRKKLEEIKQVVEAFDDKLQQVLIEAKIVQVTLEDKYKMGVDWEAVLHELQKEINVKSTFELATINTLTPGAQVVVGTLASSDYAVMVQALKTIGDTNLLSSPRITALNNQEAKILVGTSQPYATNIVTQGTATTTTATELTFIEVGVKLYVTPTINKDGYVTMKIKPEVSSVSGSYTYGSPSTTVPIVSTTQAETSVMVQDGTTIIIAGLIKDERISSVSKVPVLGDIPIIGDLFKKTDKEVEKQELVVFLTPHILTPEEDYIRQPMSRPIGEKRFTQTEKPAFERRRAVELKPTYFKERTKFPGKKKVIKEKKKEGQVIPKTEKAFLDITPEEYYYNVKNRIFQNIELDKALKEPSAKGMAKIAFTLSSDGRLAGNPRVLKSTNSSLNRVCIKVIRDLSPFPEFPSSIKQAEKRFVIDVVLE